MKAIALVIGVCLILFAITNLTAAPPTAPAVKIERGKYLVERVGMCGDCHTPHDEKGEPIREKWLQGSPLSFKPIVPIPVWADKTPSIAGLPGWEDKDAVKFLMTGMAYNNLPGRPPMPQYRMPAPSWHTCARWHPWRRAHPKNDVPVKGGLVRQMDNHSRIPCTCVHSHAFSIH